MSDLNKLKTLADQLESKHLHKQAGEMTLSEFRNKYGTDTASIVMETIAHRVRMLSEEDLKNIGLDAKMLSLLGKIAQDLHSVLTSAL